MNSRMRSLGVPLVALALLGPAGARGQGEDKITTASLPGMLKGLGYVTEKNGETNQKITIERDKFTFRLNLSVSGNEKKLWMSSYLVQIADPSKVPADLLSAALLANGDTGPAHYYLVKLDDGKYWLKMGYALDNHGITPAFLRGEIDWFIERMTATASVWDASKWPKAQSAAKGRSASR